MAVPYNTLETLTRELIMPEVIDQFFTSSALLMRLLKRKKTIRGGSKIQQPISYINNSQAGAWRGGFETLPMDQQEVVTKSEHDWTYYQVPIVWAETDKLKNMGEEEVADLAEVIAQNALMSLKDTMGVDIYSDGSNNASGAKRLDGLSAIITHNANPSPGSYGGISRASSTGEKASYSGNAWWNGQSVAVNAGAVTRWTGQYNFSNASTVIDLNKINQMFTLLSIGDDSPDLIVMAPALFAKLWALIQTNERIPAGESDVGKAGFRFIMINGVPCVPDNNIDDQNKIYFLNTKYLFWRPHAQSDFKQTPLRTPSRQRVAAKYIFWDGNMVCTSPRMQGMLTGCTAA